MALEPLFDFLSLVIWTGAIAGERPASCIIIAPPGAGKTSILEMMHCETAPMVSDLTSRDVSRVLTEQPKATHIILGDLMSLFGHKTSVVSLTCRMISSLTGESLKTDSFSGKSLQDRQLGLISAIPPSDFRKRSIRSHFEAGGFATRFLTICYSYSPSTKAKIHEYIMADLYTKGDAFHFEGTGRGEKLGVYISPENASAIHALAQSVKSDDLGTRTHRHLRTLVKARARRASREEATREDVDAIAAYVDFFDTERGKVI